MRLGGRWLWRYAVHPERHDNHLAAALIRAAYGRERVLDLDFGETKAQRFRQVIAIEQNRDGLARYLHGTERHFRRFVGPGCASEEDEFSSLVELEPD